MSKKDKIRRQINKKAILLAHFGTSYPVALESLENIKKKVRERFPSIETRICFTSNRIRNIWAARRRSPEKWLEQGVSEEIMSAPGFLGAAGSLQNENYRTIIVQPTHIYHGEQYEDLQSYVRALQSIRTIKKAWAPFEKILLSRPALGTYGIEHDHTDDINEVVEALGADFSKAEKEGAALVYVGHGNDFFSSGAFLEAQKAMRDKYPGVKVYIGMVEGHPGIEEIVRELGKDDVKQVLLKPFMITAGDHAHNDINNDDHESWKGRIESMGIHVDVSMEGLGSNNTFADVFVKRIQETADENGLDLEPLFRESSLQSEGIAGEL